MLKIKKQIVLSLEGIDGCGKTTIVNRLHEMLPNSIVIFRAKKGIFLEKIILSRFMKKYYMLQVPFYITLSNLNFKKVKNKNKANILIMDRCFLSNLCYFFPKAIESKILFKFIMLFEPRIKIDKIFILDVDLEIGHKRDDYQKPMKWLTNTYHNYIKATNSEVLKDYKLEIINKNLSMEEKIQIILSFIYKERN